MSINEEEVKRHEEDCKTNGKDFPVYQKEDPRGDKLKLLFLPEDIAEFLESKKNWPIVRRMIEEHMELTYDTRNRLDSIEHQLYHLVEEIIKSNVFLKKISESRYID